MNFPPTHLKDRAVLEVTGPVAATFLQGLVSNDIAKAANGRAIYAALLTPQGKIIYDFIVAPAADGYFFDCASTHCADLAARLKKYKLRAKVTIAERPDLAVEAAPDPQQGAVADPRLPALGFRRITPTPAAGDEAAYNAARIALGVPDSADIAPETHFPLDCNFEELHGVDFDKGCYVGQELTARMKHRATARRRILIASSDTTLPPPGTPVTLGPVEIGELLGNTGTKGLAILRLDRLGSATEATAGGHTIRIARPAYPLVLGE